MYDGELIKQLRVNRKLTQTQLAKGICSKTSLVGIENHTVKKISFCTLKAFLERLNISLAEYEWLRNQLEEPKKTKKSRRSSLKTGGKWATRVFWGRKTAFFLDKGGGRML